MTGHTDTAPAVPLPDPAALAQLAAHDRRAARRLLAAQQRQQRQLATTRQRTEQSWLRLELRRQRRRDHIAEQRRRSARRRARRTIRRRRLRRVAATAAARVIPVSPIVFPMVVAWTGQIRFARHVLDWPTPAAVVFAAAYELTTAWLAGLTYKARHHGDRALVLRTATWLYAGLAAAMNYWHTAPDLVPNPVAVSYGAMSLSGIGLWELYAWYRHRLAQRAAGRMPPARPRIGAARWVRRPVLSFTAWTAVIDHDLTTSAEAVAAGRKALAERADRRAKRRASRSTRRRRYEGHRRAGKLAVPTAQRRTLPSPAHRIIGLLRRMLGDRNAHEKRVSRGSQPGVSQARRSEPMAGDGHARSLRTQMWDHYQGQVAAGRKPTGADLDAAFGTKDYGRKVLRDWARSGRISADTTTAHRNGGRP